MKPLEEAALDAVDAFREKYGAPRGRPDRDCTVEVRIDPDGSVRAEAYHVVGGVLPAGHEKRLAAVWRDGEVTTGWYVVRSAENLSEPPDG